MGSNECKVFHALSSKYHPGTIGYRLRSRFLEMFFAHVRIVLATSNFLADPFQLFFEDIDN